MPYRSNIPRLLRALPAAVGTGLRRGGAFTVDLARQLVPKDTTSLERTIRQQNVSDLEIIIKAGDPTATRPTDGQPVSYAAMVELGTPNSPAQPFLLPAFRAIKIDREVAVEVRGLIRKLRVR